MINKIILIAKEAGEIIRDGFGKNFSIEFKTNEANLLTEIDKKSEKLIKEFIIKEFPSHSILAEESGETNKNSEYKWVIDPLDGTTNFAHGLPIFAVSIGLQKNNQTIAGVVYDVMQDFCYSAELGNGSFCNNTKLSVSKSELLQRSLLVTGFPYNIYDNPDNAFELFIQFLKNSRGMRRLGSAAIDFCYVAKGVFDGYWEVNLQPWDICAGKLILEEAGGIVSGFNGEEININSKRILASNGLIHNSMADIIKKIIY